MTEAENLFAPLVALTPPDEGRIQKRAQSFLSMVNTMTVDSDQDYELAAGELKGIKGAWATMEADRTSFTGPLNKVLDALNARFQPHLKTLKAAEQIIKDKMLGYTAAQERIAAEARRKAEEAAAAERKRLADEARAIEQAAVNEARRMAAIEQQRIAAEQAEARRLEKIEAEARAAGDAEAARIAQENAAAQRAQAAALAAQTAREAEQRQQATALEVAAIENVAAVTVAAPVAVAQVKVSGVSSAKSYDFEVVNLLEVIQHVATHPELVSLLEVDSTKMRALVKSLGMNTKIPGLRVFVKSTLRAA